MTQSPDGQFLLMAHSTGKIFIRDAKIDKQIDEIVVTSKPYVMEFFPCSLKFGVVFEKYMRVYNILTHQILCQLDV